MKFKVDLEKLSDAELENILKLKKSGVIKKINGADAPAVPEKSKRDLMLEEIEGKSKSKPSVAVVVAKRKYHGEKMMNYPAIAKKMARIVRTSTEEWTLKNLMYKAMSGRRCIGGSDYRHLKPIFEQNLWGIRVSGKKFKRYVSASNFKKKRKSNLSDERKMYLSNRGKYVTSMAKKLCSENPSLSWAEALSRSQKDFNAKHIWKKKEATQETVANVEGNGNFPDFKTIKAPKLLKSMLRHMIEMKSQLNYEESSYPLALSLSEWKDFCSELMVNSEKVAGFFGVPNNFKLSVQDKKLVIVYYG
ncbi:hypothetical protein CMI37_22365 [Candidatus Pacearchaeota archaeon]|nr:hypothetical protein [Candidatus Pacearchaeota archaeon]|tara:strand:+ start:436 stop:1347 length:912 start_codon:yes stop_codon:yes gene_type:complete